MKETIRVAMIMGKMVGGGVESVVLNYYRYINRQKVQFDFFIDEDSTIVPEKEIISLGGRVFRLPPYQHLFSYSKHLKVLLKQNDYEIVHSHLNSLSVFPLRIAKKCGVPVRIAHNHSTSASGEHVSNVIKSCLKPLSTIYPTDFISPTKYAGQWLFGKVIANNQLFILKNAIETERFLFNSAIRKEYRDKLGYSASDFVIGNIGRMVWQKNQAFVIQVFARVILEIPEAKLLIIGEGQLKDELVQLVNDLNLTGKVSFIPYTNKVEDYFQAMDMFLFPSHYEGLGMTAIEAQVSGLFVLGSSQLPKDVELTSQYQSLDLIEPLENWVEMIKENRHYERKEQREVIIKNGYEISEEASQLANYYLQFYENGDR